MNEPEVTPTNAKNCPQCGAPLPAGVLAGLCAACLLKEGQTPDTVIHPEGSTFKPLSIEVVGRLFPQLEILGLLGQGGMGAVYKARQPALDRLVALKILPPQADGGFAARFAREARALARLSHPNIVAVHEFGQVAGPGATPAQAGETPGPLHFFLMEYVDGVTLRQLQRSGRLSPREALQIVPQICDALQYAHDEGVVHRDIKPENVLVDRKGRVKIADFGLAKLLGRETQGFRLTREGQVMGTPLYMAPEQIEHPQEVDHRADIFSMGVVFYEMLTGELPLGRFAPPSCKVQMDVRLDEVVLRTLEKEPGRRYQHAREVKTEIATISPGPPVPPSGAVAPPVSGSPEPGERAPRNWRTRARRGIGAMLALFLLAMAAVVALQHRGSPQEPATHSRFGAVSNWVVAGAINLDNGTMIQVPASFSAAAATNSPALANWMNACEMDARVAGGNLVGAELGLVGLEPKDWVSISPERLKMLTQDTTGDSLLKGAWNTNSSSNGPATYGFKTRKGALGLAQLLERVDDPPGIKIRCKLVRTLAGADANAVMASAEWWWPALEPGAQPEASQLLDEAGQLMKREKYEDALQRFLWVHNHHAELASEKTFRLPYYPDWVELGRRYPKARQAMMEIRDRGTRALREGQGYAGLFTDVSSLDQYLQDDDTTFDVFMAIRKMDPALAKECYSTIQPLLMKRHEYKLCLEYTGDPETTFASFKFFWEMRKDSDRRQEEFLNRLHTSHPELKRPAGAPGALDPSKMRDDYFVGQTRVLIEILVGAGHEAEGQHIRDEALALLDDPRFKSAVTDAEAHAAEKK